MSLNHPTRIEVEAKANASAILSEMLHRKTEAARPGRAEHEPVRAFGEVLIRQRVAEELIVESKILDRDAAFGNPGRAAGFENVNGTILVRLRYPSPHGSSTQPLILEQRELA